MIIKEFLRANWHLVTIAATAVAAVSAAFFLLRTMPPGTVVMATGAEGGGYQQMGRRYQAALARAGVELKLVPTPGSLENLALLRDARIYFLLRDSAGAHQHLRPRQIFASAFEPHIGQGYFGLGAFEFSLVRARINDEEQVALLHGSAIFEMDGL